MKFGKMIATQILDEIGSNMTVTNVFRGGKLMQPSYVKYEVRVRIPSNQDESDAIANAVADMLSDASILDSAVKIVRPPKDDGYYEMVKTYGKYQRMTIVTAENVV